MISISKSALTSLTSLSIWVVALLINAIGDILYMSIPGGISENLLDGFGYILLFSAIFSLPGIIVFWLVFLFNNDNENIFFILLATAVLMPAVSVLLLSLSFGGRMEGEMIWFTVIAGSSAFMSTVFHFYLINEVSKK